MARKAREPDRTYKGHAGHARGRRAGLPCHSCIDSTHNTCNGIRSDKHLLMFLQTICALAIMLFIVVQAGPLLAIANAPRDITTNLQLVLGVIVVALHFVLYVVLLVWTRRTFDALERFGPIHRHFIERWERQRIAEAAKAASPP